MSTEIDPVMARLEDQIGWYDRKSIHNQKIYKRIKTVEIIAAALIPSSARSARMCRTSSGCPAPSAS